MRLLSGPTLAAACALGACASAPPLTPALPAASVETVQAPIRGADGGDVGLVTLAQGPGGVVIRINLLPGVLEPGWHGVHLHEVGDCSGDFTGAGAHVGHGGRAQHGLLAEDGPEAGDLPNLLVPPGAPQGPAVEMYSPYASLEPSRSRMNLRDRDGSALVIHANADDHVAQPIGGAGPRVACAVISPAG
jgi:Cu-Zn family superoxide dismutase